MIRLALTQHSLSKHKALNEHRQQISPSFICFSISNSYFIINRKIANLNVIISARVELFLARFALESGSKAFFTVDGNSNRKYLPFWVPPIPKARSTVHKLPPNTSTLEIFYCLDSLAHCSFTPTIPQLIILYDWKIFLLDTIDGAQWRQAGEILCCRFSSVQQFVWLLDDFLLIWDFEE